MCEVKGVLLSLLLWLKPNGIQGNKVIHVRPGPDPVCQPPHGALLSGEDGSRLLQLLLVPLQVAEALGLKQGHLLLPVVVNGDVLAHVRVEAEIGVSGQEAVQHGVDLWRAQKQTNKQKKSQL